MTFFVVGDLETGVDDTTDCSESEEEYDEEEEESSDDEIYQDLETFEYNKIADRLRRDASKRLDKLTLQLPDGGFSERLLNRLGDFLKTDLKREVTELYINIRDFYIPFNGIRSVICPSGLQKLNVFGKMGNASWGILVRNVLGSNFSRLKKIVFSDTNIADGSIVRDLLLNNPQLEKLEIREEDGSIFLAANGIRDITTGLQGPVKQNFLHLDIGGMGIGDTDFVTLCDGLSECKSLKKLQVHGNSLTRASVPFLATLATKLPSLSILSIGGNAMLFVDIPLSEVQDFFSGLTGQLKSISIQQTGLSGPATASIIEILSTSHILTSLSLNIEHTETQRALERYIPKFQSLRMLWSDGGWTPQLTQAVLRNTSLSCILIHGNSDDIPDSVRNQFFPHFASNKQIVRARDLLRKQGLPNNAVPLGLWPKVLSAISRTPEKHGETAIFLTLQSQLAHWQILNQEEEEDDDDENKEDSKPPPSGVSASAHDGSKDGNLL